MLLYGEKVKTMDFSETVVVYDINVGRCSHLHEYMKLHEYQKSFIDLGPNHPDSIFLNFFSTITADFNISAEQVSDTDDQWSSGLNFKIVKYYSKIQVKCMAFIYGGSTYAFKNI